MIDKLLPSYCYSKYKLLSIDGIIVHYYSAIKVEPGNPFDMDVCRNLFLDLNRKKSEREFYMLSDKYPDKRMFASGHIMIGREGERWKLVPFTHRAHHAGHSIMHDRPSCNSYTLGVELVGTVNSGFTDAQYQDLSEFCADVMDSHDFGIENIKGHDQVRWDAIQYYKTVKPQLKIAKKYDPSGSFRGDGNNFDWDKLYGYIRNRRR